VKGFTQKPNIDYFDIFALVTMISSIRLLLALASIHKLVIPQINVKTTFLNGELEEEIYMTQPEGCVVPDLEKKLCKLCDGLKQTPKQWHEKLDNILLCDGFLITMLINMCTLSQKMVNVSLYVYMGMTC